MEAHYTKIDDLVTTARDAITVRRVYGEPVTQDAVTVIAAASVWGGGGGGRGRDQQGQEGQGGGFGLHARPVGAYVIKGRRRAMDARDRRQPDRRHARHDRDLVGVQPSAGSPTARQGHQFGLVERELLAVIIEVLAGVVVDVGQAHCVGEERVPPSGEVHLPREGGVRFFFDVTLQGRDHAVYQTAHSSVPEDGSHRRANSNS